MFDLNPRVDNLARTHNVNMSASHEVQSNLSTAPYFYLRATLSDNGNSPRSAAKRELCRFAWYVNLFFFTTNKSHIQPLWTVQNLNPAVILADFTVDVSCRRQIEHCLFRWAYNRTELWQNPTFLCPGFNSHPSKPQPSFTTFSMSMIIVIL